MTERQNTVSGIILDETVTISLDELSGACEVQTEQIVALVEEGIIEPLGGQPQEWRFPVSTLPRVRTAMRLQQDLEINLAGVALALDLLDELSVLRNRLRMQDEEF